MRAIICLICGAVVLGSLFIAWFSNTEGNADDGWLDAATYFGHDLVNGEADRLSSSGPDLVMTGGIFMVVGAVISLAMAVMRIDRQRVFAILDLATRLSAVLVVIGAAMYLIDARDLIDEFRSLYGAGDEVKGIVEEGVWICLAFAVAGLFSGITSPFSVWRTPPVAREAIGDEETSGPGIAPSHIREYYDKKSDASVTPDYRGRRAESSRDSIEVNPKLIKERFDRACDYEAQGQYAEAIAAYRKVLEVDPDHVMAYFNRGSLLLVQGHTIDAREDFEMVIKLSDNPDLVQMAKSRIDEMDEIHSHEDEADFV